MALSLVLAFAFLGSEVLEGDTRGFDEFMSQRAHSVVSDHPPRVAALRDLSALGSGTVLTLLVSLTAGYLLLRREATSALLLVIAAVSGSLLVSTFKEVFGRSRPPAAYAEFATASLSFPSGHAALAATVYLTIGVLVASTRDSRSERIYVLTSTALLALLVGLSRVALGVHWATDVLGGWAFGSAWAIGWLLCARLVVSRLALGVVPPGVQRTHLEADKP